MQEQTEQKQPEEEKPGLKRKLEMLKEGFESEDPNFSRIRQIRSAVGALALAGMLLPWVRLDGYTKSMSGADLIAYAFTGTDRGAIFDTSIMGALGLLLIPSIVLAACAYAFLNTMTGRRPLKSHLVAAIMPLGMLLMSGGIVSSDGPQIAGIPIPGFGLIITVLAQGGLFVNRMLGEEN